MKKARKQFTQPTHELIAFCARGCGALVFAAYDLGRRDLDKEIAALVREGCEVKRVPFGEAKKLLGEKHFGCTNAVKESQESQMTLFSEVTQ